MSDMRAPARILPECAAHWRFVPPLVAAGFAALALFLLLPGTMPGSAPTGGVTAIPEDGVAPSRAVGSAAGPRSFAPSREPVLVPEPAAGPQTHATDPPAAGKAGDLADLAAALEKKRRWLEGRERALDLRERALGRLRAELDARLSRLEAYQRRLAELTRELDEKEEARLARLVAVYENMKPKRAAAIFDRLELEVLLRVATRMKERKLSVILSYMEPGRAREITRALSKPMDRPKLE